jgi:hypothetical protein
VSSGGDARAAPEEHDGVDLSLRKLMAENRALSLGALAIVVALAAMIVVGALASGPVRVSDSTSCSTWSSANRDAQTTYARLFVREHGALASGARDVSSIKDAIDAGCTQAFSFDEADTLTVLQAARRQY